ncbi:MAG TPA: hypothetical protein VGU43_04310 [Thermoplasmata archaeon]|nr:hypothetical protein [Thermoplasmata archaeon]
MSTNRLPGEAVLWERLRAAEKEIGWTEVPARTRSKRPRAPTPRIRVAKLHDEEARFELSESGPRCSAVASSGPVGALLLLLEMDRRGAPGHLYARAAAKSSPYPDGAIEAEWGSPAAGDGRAEVPIEELLALVRYAL